ncbi:MAG TPA: hypothetical protein EYQ61_00160 [Dehalococcoidia bacterium]|jgi:hypothetical protein|nr:hypothetical protein [Dehalococcoidia bacterium]HIK88842.1 hypothetical protein [Dehalococcoidia bacterium]
MPISKHRTHLLLAALLLVAFAAIACSSSAESESEPSASIGNYETCEGFIDAQSIEKASDTDGLVDRIEVFDVASIPGLADSGATDNCLIEVFRTIGGDDSPTPGESVTVSLVRFETNELAELLYNSTLASAILAGEQLGELSEIQQRVVGTDSYLMDIKSVGIGAIVVFVQDSTFISMSSTADNEGNSLLDSQKLVNAAAEVQARLP